MVPVCDCRRDSPYSKSKAAVAISHVSICSNQNYKWSNKISPNYKRKGKLLNELLSIESGRIVILVRHYRFDLFLDFQK